MILLYIVYGSFKNWADNTQIKYLFSMLTVFQVLVYTYTLYISINDQCVYLVVYFQTPQNWWSTISYFQLNSIEVRNFKIVFAIVFGNSFLLQLPLKWVQKSYLVCCYKGMPNFSACSSTVYSSLCWRLFDLGWNIA